MAGGGAVAGTSAETLFTACLLARASASAPPPSLRSHGMETARSRAPSLSSYRCSLSSQPVKALPAGSSQKEPLRCPGCSCVLLRMEARSSPLARAWGHLGGRSSPCRCGAGGAEQAKAPCSRSPSPVSPRASAPSLLHGTPPVWQGWPTPGRGKAGGHAWYPPCPRAATPDAQCPRGTLYPHTGTFLVHRENIKHTANTLLSLNRLRWADPSRPMPSQSPSNGSFGKTKGPGFIAECDGTWHGVPSLVKLGRLSLLGPLPASRPTAQPARSGTRREKQRKPWRSASAVPHQRKRWCVFNTV